MGGYQNYRRTQRKVALENMWQYKDCLGTKAIVHSTCSKPAEFVKYMDGLGNDCFVGCPDIGHALLLREDPAEFIRILGNEYLKALHVHDVNGFVDTHTLPYYGGMGDWNCISQALYVIGYGGEFTFEAGNFIKILPKELRQWGPEPTLVSHSNFPCNGSKSLENTTVFPA